MRASKNKITSNHCNIKLNVDLKTELPNSDKVYITGNLPELGNWDPAGIPLSLKGPGKYEINFVAHTGSIVECKLTRGTWKTQGIYEPSIVPPSNLVIPATKDGEINVSIVDWLDQQQIVSDPVIGTLVDITDLKSPALRYDRKIQVWLPLTYSERGPAHAVLYMHDGQNLFEPDSAFAGIDWKVDEAITKLISAGQIKNCIVVGIENSPDRMQELNLFTDPGTAYADYVVNVVKPYIDNNFNVLHDTANTGIMGSSMGGLMSFQMICRYPDVFGKAGCLSSAFQKTYGRIFDYVTCSKNLPHQAKIYLDTGEYEPSIAQAYFAMMRTLKERGFIEGHNLMGLFDEKATHCEAAWAKRLHYPLQFLFNNSTIYS